MRKVVPPTSPPRPPAVPAAPAAPPGSAAVPRPRRDVRWARVAVWFLAAYALGVIAWQLLDRRVLRLTYDTANGVSLGEPWVVCLWGFALAPPLMAAASLLAVAAVVQAARGRYAGNLVITYALTLITLIVIQFSSIASLVAQGTIQYFQNGQSRSLHMGSGVVLPTALTAAALSAPLVALLIPPIRRACFNSTNN